MKTQNLSLLLILMDTESFSFYVKPKDTQKDTAEDVVIRFDI